MSDHFSSPFGTPSSLAPSSLVDVVDELYLDARPDATSGRSTPQDAQEKDELEEALVEIAELRAEMQKLVDLHANIVGRQTRSPSEPEDGVRKTNRNEAEKKCVVEELFEAEGEEPGGKPKTRASPIVTQRTVVWDDSLIILSVSRRANHVMSPAHLLLG